MSVPPVECVYVTEDCVREWKSGNPSFKVSQPVPMLRFLYELSWTMVRGELPFPKCKVALDSVIFSDKASVEKRASIFADIVSQMAQDHTMSGEFRSRLIKMARWLVESGLVPVRLLHERCEEEFLGEAELIKIKAQELKGKELEDLTSVAFVFFGQNLISWWAKMQTPYAESGKEAEYRAAAEILWIQYLFHGLQIQIPTPIIFFDN